MATPAQILANRENAHLSTGPRTEAGKAVVAKNRLSHGLNSDCLLPHEDKGEFQALIDSLAAEHQAQTPTETFLVEEMAHAQWKLVRVRHLEREILKNDGSNPTWAAVAEKFVADCAGGQALLKLNRYENSARRAWYKALNQLRALRNDQFVRREEAARAGRRELENFLGEYMEAPPPKEGNLVVTLPPPDPQKPVCETKLIFASMPPELAAEWQRHRRRDPHFDAARNASQMSRRLRKWFERNAA